MAVLKEDEFEGFLKRRLSNFSALLLHGDDEAVISAMGAQAIAALVGDGGASLLTDELDSAACKKSPGLFFDALNAMSLLGDKRLLILDNIDDASIGFLSPSLEQPPGGNFVVLKARALKRDSSLRAAFEGGAYAATVAVFPDDGKAASVRARNFLQANELAWGDGAEETFFDLVGLDRSIVSQELGKLALYCLGAKAIQSADVVAVCGDLAENTLDDAIDAILSGDLQNIDHGLGAATGREAKSVLPLLSMHLSRLVNLNSAIAEGQNADSAVRTARPPVFFKRRGAIVNQLNRLKLEDIVNLQISVQALVLKSRQLGDISDSATARALLSLARNLKQNTR